MTEQQLKDGLNKCNTFQDMLTFLESNYDLTQVRPGIMSKPLLISGLLNMMKTYKPPVRATVKP
jgi:hypothetical protein